LHGKLFEGGFMPNAMAALQRLSNLTAREGDIITSEYHNTLREAVMALAEQMGSSPSRSLELTFLPTFQLNEDGPNWRIGGGSADKPADKQANGMLPVQLPDGTRIQSLTVTGKREGEKPALFRVTLMRLSLADGGTQQLIDLSLKEAPSPFKVSAGVNVSGAGPAALLEYSKVDNRLYTYFVTARMLGAQDDSITSITSVQISLNR
jgi:hypothetical protein